MKRQKGLILLLVIVMVMSLNFSVFAASGNDENKEAKVVNTGLVDEKEITIEEQLKELESTKSELSKEQYDMVMKKVEVLGLKDSVEKLSGSTTKSTTWTTLSYTIWKQEESYYCVPASVKSAMNYLTGSSDSQDDIADDMGTTTSGTPFSAARTYLNNNQSDNCYILGAHDVSLTSMKASLELGIDQCDAPPLISVKLSTSDGWAYNTSGHTMVICGMRDDLEYFKIGDPYIKWVNSSASMFYDKSDSKIKDAIEERGNGFIF